MIISETSFFDYTVTSLVFNDCLHRQPTLSILIPTFNRSHLVKQAIDSALKQCTKIDYEVVIIDNDSEAFHKNELLEYVRKLNSGKIKVFFNKYNIGMFGNWNAAIFLANAENVTILNDDDILGCNFIRLVEEKFGFEELIVTSSHVFQDEFSLSKIKFHKKQCLYKKLKLSDLLIENPVRGSLGMVFNKTKALEIGGYNEECWPTSDYDFTFRYFMQYGAIRSKAITSAYRWAENESLKIDTLNCFLKNDYLFRMKFIDQMMGLKKSFFYKLESCHLASMCAVYHKINQSFYLYETKEISHVNASLMKLMKLNIVRHGFNMIYSFLWKVFF